MSATVIDGGLVHYEAFGRGRGSPIVFIHGWLGSWRYWMPTMEAMAAIDHPVYALDLWGFGDSDKTKERYDVQSYIDLLASFINHLGIDKPVLVGHALGAAIALEYSSQHPKQVHKIMAVSLPFTAEAVSRRLVDFTKNSMMSRVLWWRQISFREVQDETEKVNDQAITTSVASLAKLDIPARVKQSSVPILVVYGEKDNIVTPTLVPDLNGNPLNVHPLPLPDIKHFPMLEDSARFSRLLKDFVDLDGKLSELTPKSEWRRRTR
ncbi:MAG: alpha/beta fold hydrolase [Anaerolineae bacterium]